MARFAAIRAFALWLGCALSIVSCQETVDQRPIYHVMPRSDWMNDPNGPMYWNGQYHLFFQCNPDGATWGDMHWGHAVSADLINWRRLPYALSPDQAYDIAGVFTGSVTIGPNGPVIIYTGDSPTDNQTTCVAFPQDPTDPDLVSWLKYSNNPVIAEPDQSVIKTRGGFRDPTTAWQTEDGQWHILMGAGLVDDKGGWHGAVMAFESGDLINWSYDGVFQQQAESSPVGFWECPDFFPIGDLFVLKYSEGPGGSEFPMSSDHWQLGTYNWLNNSFTPTLSGTMDFGQFYASKSFNDPVNARQIIWGWITENDPQSNWVARGWSGAQSLPRHVFVGQDGQLHTPPIPEIDQLRNESWSFPGLVADSSSVLLGVKGDTLEIDFNFSSVASTVISFGINVRVSPTTNETTSIVVLPSETVAAKGTGACSAYNMVEKTASDVKCDLLDEAPAANTEECCQQCTARRGCRAWTFADGVCSLKRFGPCGHHASPSGYLSGSIGIDRSMSSIADPVPGPDPTGPFLAGNDVRVYIDKSVVEIFANQGGTVVSSRIYPSSLDSLGIEVFSVGGSVTFDVLVSQMNTIWIE